MKKFAIEGGAPLKGKIKVSGAKNAALPILFATLLTDETCVLKRVPKLRDIDTTFKILESLGKKITYLRGTATISAGTKLKTSAPYDLVKQMRASFLVAGPLLARFKTARVPLPGGCAIGLRPVDIHLKGFALMGASETTDQGDIVLEAKELKPSVIELAFPSVGATQNLLMAAVLIKGTTVIKNIAMEPEVCDLANFLIAMGANIKFGKDSFTVEGVEKLNGVTYSVIADRIVAGTYLLMAAATGGKITVEDCVPEDLKDIILKLKKSGADITCEEKSIALDMTGKRAKAVSIVTEPHPGFPTDLQAVWMAYMCTAKGTSKIEERIFENRFMHVPELARMGAMLAINSREVLVEGVERLSGATVMSSDLRGGVALVLAGLCAEGKTVVDRIYHIERGYENLQKNLSLLGAKIRVIKN